MLFWLGPSLFNHRAAIMMGDFGHPLCPIESEFVPVVCKRGEERAIEDYEKVLDNKTMPQNIRVMLKTQLDKIETSLKNLNLLIPVYQEA